MIAEFAQSKRLKFSKWNRVFSTHFTFWIVINIQLNLWKVQIHEKCNQNRRERIDNFGVSADPFNDPLCNSNFIFETLLTVASNI